MVAPRRALDQEEKEEKLHRKDCINFNDKCGYKNKCQALNDRYSCTDDCPFYKKKVKTKAPEGMERVTVNKRLAVFRKEK